MVGLTKANFSKMQFKVSARSPFPMILNIKEVLSLVIAMGSAISAKVRSPILALGRLENDMAKESLDGVRHRIMMESGKMINVTDTEQGNGTILIFIR